MVLTENSRRDDSLEKDRTIHDVELNPRPVGYGRETDPIIISDSEDESDDITILYESNTPHPTISSTMYNNHSSVAIIVK